MNKHQPTCHSTTAVQRCRDDGGDFWVYTTPTQKWKKFRGHDIATLLILILPCKLNSLQGLTMSIVVSHSTSMGLNSTIVFFVRSTTYYFSCSRSCNKVKLHLKVNCVGENLSRTFSNLLPAQIVMYNPLLFYNILVYDPCSRSCVHCADKLKVIRELTSNLRLESTF